MRCKLGHRVDNSCASGSARRCSSAQFGLRRRKAERFETKNNKTRAWRPVQPRKRDEHNGSFVSHANGYLSHVWYSASQSRREAIKPKQKTTSMLVIQSHSLASV
jgi:hypothetical protein